MKRSLIYLFAVIAVLFASLPLQAKSKVIPPVMEVTYQGKLSSEPVHVQTIAVPDISMEAARDAVVRAATNRTWETQTLDNGDIQAKLTHRSHESTLTFKVKENFIEVWSVSYKINKKSQARKKRDEPEGWIRNLHKDILDLLGLLPE